MSRVIQHNAPGDRCAAPRCRETGVERLREAVWAGRQLEFAMCRRCSDEYRAMGYEPIGMEMAA